MSFSCLNYDYRRSEICRRKEIDGIDQKIGCNKGPVYDRGEMEFDGGGKCVKTTAVSRVKLCVDIPEWLLVEVLVRLPVKQVFRAKLVSKQWLSVISDPSFVRMYVSRASESTQSQVWTFLGNAMYVHGHKYWEHSEYELLEDVYSKDLKSPNLLVLRCPLFNADQPVKKYQIGGVSNGLVLCIPKIDMHRRSIYSIYNPITGQCISLPPCIHHRFYLYSFVTRVENGVLLSYRVVRRDLLLEATNIIRFEVFVSETNEWKDFDVCIDQAVEFACANPTTLNGILHWKAREHRIIAYDPYENPESLRFIDLPRDVDPKNDKRHTIGFCDAHQGSLRYFEVSGFCMLPHGFSSFEVWILNDYKTEEWLLQHKIYSDDVLYDHLLFGKFMYLTPISFHPFDPEIVYMEDVDFIISYNIKTRKLEAHGGLPKDKYWWMASTFVVPPWPTTITPRS